MILLSLDTEHFHFEAAGNTDTEANDALENALRYHGEAYTLPEQWWKDHYDIERREIEPGECFRIGQLLYRKS